MEYKEVIKQLDFELEISIQTVEFFCLAWHGME